MSIAERLDEALKGERFLYCPSCDTEQKVTDGITPSTTSVVSIQCSVCEFESSVWQNGSVNKDAAVQWLNTPESEALEVLGNVMTDEEVRIVRKALRRQ